MGTCVFCFDSALFIMRHARERLVLRPRTEMALDEADGGLRDLEDTPWPGWLGEANTIHLVTSIQARHRKSPGGIVHVWGREGEVWPVVDLAEGVYVVAPEFLFLQMASVLSERDLVFFGCELCGCYAFAERKVVGAPRITTAHDIEEFLQSRPGARGRDKALRAIRHVIDNSASPMETELALRLSLPVRMGGWGLEKPSLNHELKLDEGAARSYGFDEMAPDLLWERQRFALEYDSDAEHVGSEHIAHDSIRRTTLEGMEIHVLSVTNPQLRSPKSFDALACATERALGKRHRDLSPATLRKRAELARELHRLAVRPEAMTLAAQKPRSNKPR